MGWRATPPPLLIFKETFCTCVVRKASLTSRMRYMWSLVWAGLGFSSLLLFWRICPQGMNSSCSAWDPSISCVTWKDFSEISKSVHETTYYEPVSALGAGERVTNKPDAEFNIYWKESILKRGWFPLSHSPCMTLSLTPPSLTIGPSSPEKGWTWLRWPIGAFRS